MATERPTPDERHPRDAAWWESVASPLRLVVGVLVLVLLVDLAISPFAATQEARPTPKSRQEVRASVGASAEDAWIFVGDSVLAGDVLEGAVPDAAQRRVIDYARSLKASGEVDLEQVAMNGVLPTDVLGVVEQLDAVDPEGKRKLVIELNPRFFSKSYAKDERCAYDWLCPMAAGTTLWTAAGRDARLIIDFVAQWIPVYRHRHLLAEPPRLEALATTEAAEKEEDPLMARARLGAHYKDWVLEGDSHQLDALDTLLERLAAKEREALFFLTPINEAFFAGELSERELGRLSGRLGQRIADAGATKVRFVDLDHPRFGPDLFLDHCHLLPDGNRLLAINLLAQMGVRLGHRPERTELVYPIADEQTLIGRIDRGFRDGPSWMAQTHRPEGVALAPNGDVIIADTGNNSLRRIPRGSTSLVTWVGHPNKKKDSDGDFDTAGVSGPFSPVYLGEHLYFASAEGQHLRRIVGGKVETIDTDALSRSGAIAEIVADRDKLLLRVGNTSIWEFDPATQEFRKLIRAPGEPTIVAIAASGTGRRFFGDSLGRVVELLASKRLQHYVPYQVAEHVDGAEPEAGKPRAAMKGPGWKVLFANTGWRIKTKFDKKLRRRRFFPFDFHEYQIKEIESLHWVERYGGLLLAWRDPPKKEHPYGLTETIQLDYLDLEEERVFPWTKPRAFGGARRMWNHSTKSFVSPIHEGSLVIDQKNARVYHLERERPRLVRLDDGLLGIAKVGHASTPATLSGLQELYGGRAGREAAQRFDPVSHFEQTERLLDGPFVVAITGTSLTVMADRVGMYSIARVLEATLRERLAAQERIGLELFQRVRPGGSFPELVSKLEEALPNIRPDIIIVGGYETLNPEKLKPVSDDDLKDAVDRLVALGRHYDAPVFMLDMMPIASWHREGLRTPPEQIQRQYEFARAAGIEVIQLGDLYLHDHLEDAPWGSPPFKSGHGSPWSLDGAAERIADHLYPRLAKHFRGREPNWTKPPPEELAERGPDLASALSELDEDVVESLPELGEDAVRVESRPDALDILVDVRGKKLKQADPEDLALAGILAAIAENELRGRALEVRVRLVEFTNFDEYGAGVLDGATILWDRSFDVEGLRAFVEASG